MGRLKAFLGGIFDADRPALIRESETHPDPRYDKDDPYLAAMQGNAEDFDRAKAARICRTMTKRNPMARRIIRLNEDYVVGNNVQVRIDLEDEGRQAEVQKELERWKRVCKVDTAFWQRLWKRYQTDGELAIRMVPLGKYPRPVILDTTGMGHGEDELTKDVVVLKATDKNGSETLLSVRNSLTEYDQKAGEAHESVLFFAHDGDRGTPELLPNLSRLQWEDEITRLEIARVKALRKWFWQVQVEGATDEELQDMNDQYSTAPRSGAVRWTNEKVQWSAVTPQAGAYETNAFLKALRTTIAGGAGHPMHWHGDGGDANRATATEMGNPSYRQMERFQAEFQSIVEAIYDWVVEELSLASRVGEIDAEGISWDVTLPEVNPRDFETGTKSIIQASAAVDASVASHYITFDAGQRIMREIIQNVTGVELMETDLGKEPEAPPNPFDDHGTPPEDDELAA